MRASSDREGDRTRTRLHNTPVHPPRAQSIFADASMLYSAASGCEGAGTAEEKGETDDRACAEVLADDDDASRGHDTSWEEECRSGIGGEGGQEMNKRRKGKSDWQRMMRDKGNMLQARMQRIEAEKYSRDRAAALQKVEDAFVFCQTLAGAADDASTLDGSDEAPASADSTVSGIILEPEAHHADADAGRRGDGLGSRVSLKGRFQNPLTKDLLQTETELPVDCDEHADRELSSAPGCDDIGALTVAAIAQDGTVTLVKSCDGKKGNATTSGSPLPSASKLLISQWAFEKAVEFLHAQTTTPCSGDTDSFKDSSRHGWQNDPPYLREWKAQRGVHALSQAEWRHGEKLHRKDERISNVSMLAVSFPRYVYPGVNVKTIPLVGEGQKIVQPISTGAPHSNEESEVQVQIKDREREVKQDWQEETLGQEKMLTWEEKWSGEADCQDEDRQRKHAIREDVRKSRKTGTVLVEVTQQRGKTLHQEEEEKEDWGEEVGTEYSEENRQGIVAVEECGEKKQERKCAVEVTQQGRIATSETTEANKAEEEIGRNTEYRLGEETDVDEEEETIELEDVKGILYHREIEIQRDLYRDRLKRMQRKVQRLRGACALYRRELQQHIRQEEAQGKGQSGAECRARVGATETSTELEMARARRHYEALEQAKGEEHARLQQRILDLQEELEMQKHGAIASRPAQESSRAGSSAVTGVLWVFCSFLLAIFLLATVNDLLE